VCVCVCVCLCEREKVETLLDTGYLLEFKYCSIQKLNGAMFRRAIKIYCFLLF